MLTYLRPRRWVPLWWSCRVRERMRGLMRPPSVDWWGCVGRTLSQDAGPLKIDCWLGNMVALLGCKLPVFSCSVLSRDFGKINTSCRIELKNKQWQTYITKDWKRWVVMCHNAQSKCFNSYLTKHSTSQYTPSLHTWSSAPDSRDHMLLNTEHWKQKINRKTI